MSVKKPGDPYTAALERYLDSRDKVTTLAGKHKSDPDTIQPFKDGTAKWLKEIHGIHTNFPGKILNAQDTDTFTPSQLDFATISMNSVKEKLLQGMDQVDAFNVHLEQINKHLDNARTELGLPEADEKKSLELEQYRRKPEGRGGRF